MPEAPASATSGNRRRSSIGPVVVVGMVLFALVFLLAARWLGQRDREVYAIEPRPPLPPRERFLCERLGTWLPHDAPPAALEAVDGDREDVAPDPERLREAFASLAAAHPQAARWQAALGWTQLLAGRPRQALAALEEAARLGSTWDDLWLLTDIANERLGNEAGAGAAPAPPGDDPDVLLRRARRAFATGDLRGARELAGGAMRYARAWPEAHRLLGRVCLALRDHAAARRAFLDVLQLLPDDAEAKAALENMGDSQDR